jgi:hypothetical protein
MIQAQNGKDTLLIAPIAKTNSATASATYDLLGCDYATIRVSLSSEINTNAVGPAISLSEADTSNSTAFATVTADRAAEDITAAKEIVYHVDCKTRKRYLKLSVTTDTTTNDNVTVAATVTATRKEKLPASTSDMVASGSVAVLV